ncbi:MAG: TetR family transcriptional regulator [Gordonia sp.]|uniref:TetR/AcrR family transcriptional regulator n=1 Tax=Gordonia sp. (in: high G+C Gram-positive bacteria) TaxID=84139 RepID=UPI000C5FA901|nr:TetR/AcrR family transcriptional regulator [Gordonia sp. (in: high G+C Gram-positive bacteria)]MAU83942.1 TetR family transcriptional regulator [Gordonia sp. (in: high G+C Gram-positive bacteria)]
MAKAHSSRPLRKDASINRERLLDAARELFAEKGLGVTLNDIAHHAGVGVGTAYRRFANKEEVIDTLFEERLQAVEAVAREALDEPDPWTALAGYLRRTLKMQFGDRGLHQILDDPTLGDARINDVRVRIAPLIVELVRRAKDAGVVREDFEPTDVTFIQSAMAPIIDSTRDVAPAVYERYLTFFLDGIRSDDRRFTPLPAPALNSGTTHSAMTRRRRNT